MDKHESEWEGLVEQQHWRGRQATNVPLYPHTLGVWRGRKPNTLSNKNSTPQKIIGTLDFKEVV